jgi:hypothetical protein
MEAESEASIMFPVKITCLCHISMVSGDVSDVLRLELSPETSSAAQLPSFLAFKDFDSGSALDSALALVEHLMDG